jgi:hypothetical protein
MLLPDQTKSLVPSVITILADLLNSDMLDTLTATETQATNAHNTIINNT